MNFIIQHRIETRSDNPNIRYYYLKYNNNYYTICYDGEKLREVYFCFYDKSYSMSCRTDMKTISHYYINKELGKIRRYEYGSCNRTYTQVSFEQIFYEENGKRVDYIATRQEPKNQDKIKKDLLDFLVNFNQLKLYELFQPNEPK